MIEHEGVIEDIRGNHIKVRILQQSACSACHARGACMASDSREKIVDVTDSTGRFMPHEHVIIEGKQSMGLKAVLWAFVVPSLILILVLSLATSVWSCGEIEAAGISILGLIPYYAVLHLLRNRMADSFRFTIKKTTPSI